MARPKRTLAEADVNAVPASTAKRTSRGEAAQEKKNASSTKDGRKAAVKATLIIEWPHCVARISLTELDILEKFSRTCETSSHEEEREAIIQRRIDNMDLRLPSS